MDGPSCAIHQSATEHVKAALPQAPEDSARDCREAEEAGPGIDKTSFLLKFGSVWGDWCLLTQKMRLRALRDLSCYSSTGIALKSLVLSDAGAYTALSSEATT